jgi:hypothetical protein
MKNEVGVNGLFPSVISRRSIEGMALFKKDRIVMLLASSLLWACLAILLMGCQRWFFRGFVAQVFAQRQPA